MKTETRLISIVSKPILIVVVVVDIKNMLGPKEIWLKNKTRHFKVIEEKEMHIKKVSLIYRKSENEEHFPKHLDKKNDRHSDSIMKEKLSVDEFLSCI